MNDKYLDAIQNLWEEIGITQLLEEHVSLPRQYLVDRVVRLIFPPRSSSAGPTAKPGMLIMTAPPKRRRGCSAGD